MLHFAFPKYVS